MKPLTTLLLILISTATSLTAQTQIGADIDGEAAFDQSGYSISMPDSKTLAIGARLNNGNGTLAGHVRIYAWKNTTWVQKGLDIDGEAARDQSGWSVSMPDTNTVAIGAIFNDGKGSSSGHVRIYAWKDTVWVQKGKDINGVFASRSGYSVSMSDSNTVAIGAINSNSNGFGYSNGFRSGHVRIYSWNGTAWMQKGSDIDGEAANDFSGTSVSMPDSNTVAIGATGNDGNGNASGHVRIYTWKDTTWTQKGADIDGEAANDQSGQSVSMPDSNTIAIGANFNDGAGKNSGHVRIYAWKDTAWVQKGLDIDGEAAADESGFSVSMPDSNTLAIGSLNNDGKNGAFSGHVRIYKFCAPDSAIDVQTACDSLVWIDSVTYTSSTNTPTFALINAAGCDSVVTLNLTIINSSTGIDLINACDSFTWIDSVTYTSSNNTATHTLTNALGCDSVVTLDLTINNSNTGTDLITACDSFTWIDSVTYTSSNNTATHTLTNALGCDSVVTLDLTINNSNAGTDLITACDSFTWIDSVTYTSSNNTATHTLTNALGCDSVVNLDLTINNSNTGTDVITACDSFTWIDSVTYTSSTNTPTFTLTNAVGCDSVVTLDLTINNSNTGTDIVTACDSFTWIDSITYTSSTNTPTFTLTNAAGCDSVVNLDLTINSVDTSIIENRDTLTANQAGASYQWLNCDSSFQAINGETNATFIATVNGNYACEINFNSCVDTTACIQVIVTGIAENDISKNFKLFPNPFSEQLTIETPTTNTNTILEVLNIKGQKVYQGIITLSGKTVIKTGDWGKGVYFIRLTNAEGAGTFKVVHQ